MPALRRALQALAETLAGAGTSGFSARLDRLAARSGLLAGAGVPGSVRMGVRNALRQKRRSAATIAQVAVAAGLAIAFLALGQSVTAVISQTIGHCASASAPGWQRPGRAAVHQPGARRRGRHARRHATEPVETNSVQYDGQTTWRGAWDAHPFYAYRLNAGTGSPRRTPPRTPAPPSHRWCSGPPSPAPPRGCRPDPHPQRRRGPTRVRVIGIDTVPTNNGDTVYFPLPVLERLDGAPGTANSIWLTTASTAHAAIDRATTATADRLAAAGYPVSTTEIYVSEAQITAADTAYPHHRGHPGPGGGRHHAHGPGQHPRGWASSNAPGRSGSCAAWVPRPARSGASSAPRSAFLVGCRLGVRSPARLADLPGLFALIRQDVDLILPQEFPRPYR